MYNTWRSFKDCTPPPLRKDQPNTAFHNKSVVAVPVLVVIQQLQRLAVVAYTTEESKNSARVHNTTAILPASPLVNQALGACGSPSAR